ncbi:MAG: MauE/DoxX family redox-associated membrane protein [Candidatus Neomarinimicrobiota bacterium]
MTTFYKVVLLGSRLLIGFVLLYAGWNKLLDPQGFASSIGNYHLLPWGMENTVAIVFPWIEIIAGLGLIVGIFTDGSATVSIFLFTLFILAIASALLRGYNIECGCGLKSGDLVGLDKILENSVYLILSVVILRRKEKWFEF